MAGCEGGGTVAEGGGFVTATPSPTTAAEPSSTDSLTGPSSSAAASSSSGAPSSSSSAVSSAPPTTTTTSEPPTPEPPPAPPQTTEKPAAPPPPANPAPTDAEAQEAKVLDLTNQERSAAGCSPLVADKRLATSARGHSQDMANQNYFDHVSKDGRTFVDRIKAAGYPSPGAENIAAGQQTPADVMKSWMESPGHRANILNCGLKALGVGVAKGGSFGIYWTQNFGW
ncbi:CAP domain-containing protein [Umezawaea sp. Da 62-37]|uniref:CAP domain-containing protein n=1 Tax=Umezawaea sp. Da 62-37 TaxID=3075927 RepID=UPI0028F71427|nr:CAP domain-containing protein [Umezawaea sp. Da 62-37]WNV88614.1 CAP domain-containing protein [Umezawaea sp. Da 62-37]